MPAAALAQRARAANVYQLIGARANISLASQNAPKAFADTGSYAGVMPKPEDFAYVFGVEEGRRQLEKFNRSVETGKQAFDMRVMPVRDIVSQLLDAAVGAANSPEGQSRYRTTAAAAQHLLEARRKDPAGEAVKAFPQANENWRAAAAQGWRDPAAVQNALALSIAAQRYLGVENAQPVPQSVLKDLGALPPQDMWAGMNGLLAGTTDPVVKAAVKQQFAEAGLLGAQAQAQKVAPLAQDDFDQPFGLPSKAPLAGEDATPSTQAFAQSDETSAAADSPVAADSGSQAPTSEVADDNSDPPLEMTQAMPEHMDPPPGRPDIASVDPSLPKSDDLSQKWVGNSTTNISLLPEDVQQSVKPYLGALGKNFGDGECAALTKEIAQMGRTPTWKKGEKVQGNKTIVPGTPIATFNFDWGDGKGKVHYGPKEQPGGKGGVSHTGIYLGQDDEGIYILDQWNKKNAKGVKVPQKARITRREWNAKQGHGGLENGSHYYVIER